MQFNVHLIENRFPILFEPIVLKNVNDNIDEYDMVSYQQADQGVNEFLKYLVNFFFYRFGLEVNIRSIHGNEIEKVRLDVLYNNGYCHCCSIGYRCSVLCDLVGIIFSIKSEFSQTNLAVLFTVFNHCFAIAIYDFCQCTAVSLFW